MQPFTFIELQGFSKRRKELLTDDEFLQLQMILLENPEKGDVIQNTGGWRKMRFYHGRLRVIYYSRVENTGRLFLGLIYHKNEQVDLTEEQKKQLKAVTSVLT